MQVAKSPNGWFVKRLLRDCTSCEQPAKRREEPFQGASQRGKRRGAVCWPGKRKPVRSASFVVGEIVALGSLLPFNGTGWGSTGAHEDALSA